MRKSKSNPAKYTRNYRKISQRHMTGYGDSDDGTAASQILSEEKERKRLEAILTQSEQIWKRGITENEENHNLMVGTNKRDKCGKRRACLQNDSSVDNESEDQDGMLSLLSPELREQFSGMGTDNLLILPSSKSKSKAKKAQPLPSLTPHEIKAAKAQYKNTQRKLQQLEQRKKQKELRKGLYKQLEENALVPTLPVKRNAGDSGAGTTMNSSPNSKEVTPAQQVINAKDAHSLLLKSSELGKKLTKKEQLKQLRRKEALGIKLTEEEMGILYVKREVQSAHSFPMTERTDNHSSVKKMDVNESANDGTDLLQEGGSRKKQNKQQRKRSKTNEGVDATNTGDDVNKNGDLDVPAENFRPSLKKLRMSPTHGVGCENSETQNSVGEGGRSKCPAAFVDIGKSECDDSAVENVQPKLAFAQMMFASLSKLKKKSDTQNVELANKKERRKQEEKEEARRLEEEQRKKREVYIPSKPVKVSTMHRLGGSDESANLKSTGTDRKKILQHINRPADIEESRYDLPVSAMEYEIIDAVRSHDCTIICSETGSGKSTQVPQFLYEAGLSSPGWWSQLNGVDVSVNDEKSERLLIGITQPRRVAAVSTAKRVCYEMGQGDGQSIRSYSGKGNIVSYQTRYETAGLGSSTHIKFMTDGILLQEIQSDLLLRKYGAIVIDEAHERNLNTDVLLGLLSVTLPLRQKAAEEKSLPPLKLVVMSATLRVEDFTENKRLFPHKPPAVVMVPGRTHPVSIHHSKFTELDDYEKVALDKVCKIHRKLPAGGILVFLTGKQEIIRMVNRLNHRFKVKRGGQSMPNKIHDIFSERKDIDGTPANDTFDGIRDMDDEELDGDLFQNEGDEEGVDDFDNMENEDVGHVVQTQDHDDKLPKRVRILPLYSMLSVEEQAKVFAPVPDDERLIVIATNIAETSITIPGISYVVDSGRQKCRNYNAGTGVASYDIMWISKAAADQRAGRAGRTGPGHCYRLYSSSVYSRYLDDFALPEVLSRPLEDVVLAMKAMNISNVASFPFPTPPDKSQISAAVRLLANIGCVDVSNVEELGGDGKITMLGAAVAKLPLGVRYGKMLLVAAQANVLDYAIVLVSVLSESSPFVNQSEDINDYEKSQKGISKENIEGFDEVDLNQAIGKEKEHKNESKKNRWMHNGGDVLSAMMAVGAYAYASREAGGASEKHACRQFCEDNGLNLVVMQRISKMRLHLCRLAKCRLSNAGGIAAESGKFLTAMPPPKRMQELLLRQAVASGLLDNIARRAPPGILPEEFSGMPRSAYISGNSATKEPLFIDNNSTVHSNRPEWICFDSIVRKKRKDGTTVATMQRVTPIDPEWLAILCHGSNLLSLGSPLATPVPIYNKEKDSIQCAVETKFGNHGWVIPPLYVDMYDLLQNVNQKDKKNQNSALMKGDSFRWFARYLLEGKVLSELAGLLPYLNDEPAIITRRKPSKKTTLFLAALNDAGIDSAAALCKHWAEKDNKFLFKPLKLWVKREYANEVKAIWISAVTKNIDLWRGRSIKDQHT